MSKQAVTFTPTSPRHEAALRIADTLMCLELNDCYGVEMQRAIDAKGRSHWSILFCKARTVDGIVRVYSDRYIQIVIQQRRGAQRFTSVRDAQSWLVREFAR